MRARVLTLPGRHCQAAMLLGACAFGFLAHIDARCVVRSTAAFIDDTKPNSISKAQKIHSARSKAATVSAIAPRPSNFRIARVLPPLFSASLAMRAISRGVLAIFSPSSAALVPALVCTRPTSRARRKRSSAFSTFTASRTARTATAGSVRDAPASRLAQSPTSRPRRASNVRSNSPRRALRRPVLRAAFTTDRPTRAGEPAPSEA